MRTRRPSLMWIPVLLFLALALLWLVSGQVRAQSPAGDLLKLINNARLDQGLPPYVVSASLTGAAQRHSDDMAATGRIDHVGSDGSSSTQRILAAGYGVYEFGLVASENIFGGTGGAQLPFSEWMDQPGARSNLLDAKYREVGLGVANDAQGRTFWTLTVGAQPNVLPVLINDGATSADSISVTLTLLPEKVAPEGQGTAMGQPVEYRASTSRLFPDAEWSTWAERVSFALEETPGEQTVYVQLRDAAERTTISQASVTLMVEDSTITPTEERVSETPGTPTVTQVATDMPTLTAVDTPMPTPRLSPTLTGTATAAATETAAPSSTPTASATPQPTLAATETQVMTDAPTSTPLMADTATSPAPTPPLASTTHEEDAGSFSDPLVLASRLAPWVVGLQIVALILGVYVALRRPSE